MLRELGTWQTIRDLHESWDDELAVAEPPPVGPRRSTEWRSWLRNRSNLTNAWDDQGRLIVYQPRTDELAATLGREWLVAERAVDELERWTLSIRERGVNVLVFGRMQGLVCQHNIPWPWLAYELMQAYFMRLPGLFWEPDSGSSGLNRRRVSWRPLIST